jgi:hypothetical protein
LPYTLSGASAGQVVSSAIYNALGSIQKINMSSQSVLKTTFSYYGLDYSGNYFGRLYKIKTTKQPGNSPVLQEIRYTWDAAGNMLQRNDVSAGAK